MKKITKFEKVSILIWIIFSFLFFHIYIRIENNKHNNEKKNCLLLAEIANLKNESFSMDGCILY